VKQYFLGTINLGGTKNLGTLTLNVPIATDLA